MNRPSHWILTFFALVGASLWLCGGVDWIVEPSKRIEARTQRSKRPDAPRSGTTTVDGFRVAGHIVDELGWPVAGAMVSLFGADKTPVRELKSNAEGFFEAEIQGHSARRLLVSASGSEVVERRIQRAGTTMEIVLRDEVPFEVPVKAGVETSVVPLSLVAGEGRLRDEAGAQVEDGFVTVAETGHRVRVDRHGHYRIPLPIDTPSITLVAYDAFGRVAHAPVEKPNRQGLWPLQPLVLKPGSTLSGIVRDEAGNACVGASVVLEGHGIRRRVEVEDGGFFTVAGLIDGEVVLHVDPYRGHLGFSETLMLKGDTDHDVALLAYEPLHITVVDAAGEAQSDLHVVAVDGADNRDHALTDDSGKAELDVMVEPIEFHVRHQAREALAGQAELKPCKVIGFDAETRRLVVEL